MIPPFDKKGNLPPGISDGRRAQKERFGGELFPADMATEPTGSRFLDFFQRDRNAERSKGIVENRSGERAVIANERQYRITKAELRRFEDAVEDHKRSTPSKGVDPRIHKAMGDALRSEVEVLSGQIQRYEDLRDGRIDKRELDNLTDLPAALIEARIAAGLSQKALAERLGLRQQQIQRWESTLYSGVSVERLQKIIDALGMRVRETVSYPRRLPA